MSAFLEQYGVAIFTLILTAILVAFAGPVGKIVKNAINTQVQNIDKIGTEAVEKRNDSSDDTAEEDYVYAYLDKNGELVISANDLNPNTADLYDNSSNYGKCVIKNNKNDKQAWNDTVENAAKIKTVRFDGIVKPTSCHAWFGICSNLTEIKNIENLDTSICTNMSFMFSGCTSLTTLSLNDFDTKKVIDMQWMFADCKNLTTLSLRNWNCEKVTNMTWMFGGCNGLTNLDLTGWKVSNPSMTMMFATGQTSIITLTCSQDVHDKIWTAEGDISSYVTWVKSN